MDEQKIKKILKNPSLQIKQDINTIKPYCETKSVKMKNNITRIPVEITKKKQQLLATSFFLKATKEKNLFFLHNKLSNEILSISTLSSSSLRICENFQKNVEINKIFIQYRFWIFMRSFWKGSNLFKISSTKNELKIISRNTTVFPSFVGKTFLVKNGKTSLKKITFSSEMVGFKVGVFVFTKKIYWLISNHVFIENLAVSLKKRNFYELTLHK